MTGPRGGWAAGPPLLADGWVITPVHGPPGIALAARAWLAVLPADATPAEADWAPASWLADGRVAAQVPPWPAGTWHMCWLRLDWPPERPVLRAGRMRA